MLVSNFKDRLCEAIAIRKIIPAQIAKKSQILFEQRKINKPLTKPLLTNYLKGTYEAKQDNIYALALILDVNESWLMGCDVPMSRNLDSSDNSNKFFSIPVVGKITAGKPILANEYIEDYFPLIPEIYGINNPREYFYLIVRGDSMNRMVQDGDYVLIHKQDYAQDGDIVVAIVNGDNEATLKKFEQINEQFIRLIPMSTNPKHDVIKIDLKETEFKIIGKAIGNFGKF